MKSSMLDLCLQQAFHRPLLGIAMLERALLVTTALVLGNWFTVAHANQMIGDTVRTSPKGWAAIVSAKSRTAGRMESPLAQLNPMFDGRDANAEFLCNYGFRVSSYSALSENSSHWTREATPIVGTDKKVHEIRVADYASKYERGGFRVGIYSNTASGTPGDEIAARWVKGPRTCGTQTVRIPEVLLKKGTTYWIEESTPVSRRFGKRSVSWVMSGKGKNNDLYQYHYSCHSSAVCSSGYTTPWTPSTYLPHGPYATVK